MDLHADLEKKLGKNLFKKYRQVFPLNYHENSSYDEVIDDIHHIENLSAKNPLLINLYEDKQNEYPLHLKLFQFTKPVSLSTIMPILSHMDLNAIAENTFHISFNPDNNVWVTNFSLEYKNSLPVNFDYVQTLFEEALKQILLGFCEDDGFNALVLNAKLSWEEVIILRAYAKYILQTNMPLSQNYIEKTLSQYADISHDLVAYFLKRHYPKNKNTKLLSTLEANIINALDKVTSLDADKILRQFLSLINATLRTNYFQKQHGHDAYLAFKFDSKKVPELPKPKPMYEIFVYSSRFEGIHLRNGKVARGGIRWSDRREDFRTEILGLMKAQTVKNTVIVPTGAKGGFVLKKLTTPVSREEMQKEGVTCYKLFISALLDLTDNIVNNKVVRPKNIYCYDDEDPYLVVAADKGTASFSDIANGISKEYNFWLGDAFASGGSAGYDHKKMGITARGAWESIKRHFTFLNINVEKNEFTVVGIGDMSGDVFGNGMLYTKRIRLVAAFDHRDIFLDPNPNAEKTYSERLRLFNLLTSSWQDFNKKLLSKGGGIFSRKEKSITLSPEVQKLLNISEKILTPNELISAILKAPVDLLYNGGIGTYVKSSTENNAEVGDRTNDPVRINGEDVRARVVGEGGNLGFTQLGRVECAMKNILINTDFIDNSAGVDCSDHEVNIKILLNNEVKKGKLTEKKRNDILFKMTEEIAHLVLNDNYQQALVLTTSYLNSDKYLPLYQEYLKELERVEHLDRKVEFLPDDKKLVERKTSGKGLTLPELAVVLAYTKIYLQKELLKTDLPEDHFYFHLIYTAFPQLLRKLYRDELLKHRLRREIIATQLSNEIVNTMGITFLYRMQMETGASFSNIIRAYSIATHIFDVARYQRLVTDLDFKISVQTQYDLLRNIRRLQYLATRFFLKNNRLKKDLHQVINDYREHVQTLMPLIPSLMLGATKTFLESLISQFEKVGLTKKDAEHIAISRAMYTVLNVIEVTNQNKFEVVKTAKIYFEIGGHFNLVWFRDQIASDEREGYWENLARLNLRDDLDKIQRRLTISIYQSNKKQKDTGQLIREWKSEYNFILEHWTKVQTLLHTQTSLDYSIFFIALRELNDLIKNCVVKNCDDKN